MKENLKLALFASLFCLVGQPIFFLALAIWTKNWNFISPSLLNSLSAGLPMTLFVLHRMKNERATQ